MGHSLNGHLIQHLPSKKKQDQQNSKKEFVPEQSFAFIQKYFTQGSIPPPSARRHLKIPDKSDKGTQGPVPG